MKLVVGISGASGAIYGIRILEVLQKAGVETHLVMSDSAKRTIVYETDYTIDDLKKLATHVHDINDVGACISSGSFRHAGMVIAPCSIKTLSAIANSFNTNLLIRAADVCLKERRKLVCAARDAAAPRPPAPDDPGGRDRRSAGAAAAGLLPPAEDHRGLIMSRTRRSTSSTRPRSLGAGGNEEREALRKK
jgi:hypothetical protein